MAKPKMIGSIGCYITSPARMGRTKFTFDGTTKGLVTNALKIGATIGSVIKADFGAGYRTYVVVAAPHDARCGGFWVDETR